MPDRVQLSRRAGWRKPANTVVVARPTKWGNPFAVGEDVPPEFRCYLVDPLDPNGPALLRTLMSLSKVSVLRVEQAVEAHAWWLFEQPHLMTALDELRGKNLACWCKPGRPCHADTLLELANG